MAETKQRVPLATHYNAIFGPRGFQLAPHHYPIIAGIEDDRIPRMNVIGPPGFGKALAYGTLIPTPEGWRSIETLRPGDTVYHPSGRSTRVVARENWAPVSLWRIRFADGRLLTAHENHLWKVHHKEIGVRRVELPAKDGKRQRGRVRDIPVEQAWEILSTRELVNLWERRKGLRLFVPLTDPVDFNEKPLWRGATSNGRGRLARSHALQDFDPNTQLSIPPYLMGCILGDGHITNGGAALITSADAEMFDLIQTDAQTAGLSITSKVYNGYYRYTVDGVAPRIRALGMAGKRSHDKTVPPVYLRGSVEQRWALLQGLMDTDGSAPDIGRKGQNNAAIDFSTASMELAADVTELVWSLGGIADVEPRKSHYTLHGKRVEGRLSYRIHIRFRDSSKAFRLTRKRKLAGESQYSDTLKLRIIDIEPSRAEPSTCVQVDAPDGMFLAGYFVPTHNSTLFGVAIPTWEVGNDPSMTVLGVSAGEKLVGTFLHAAMEVIQQSKHFQVLYPEVRPDKNAGWSTERGLFVTGRAPGDQDASYFAAGLKSKALTGVHARLILLDDLHDESNTLTPEARADVIETYYRTLLGRADPRGCRFIATGRRWAVDDIYGHWIESGDWVVLHTPAHRPGQQNLWYDVYVPKGLRCVYSESLRPDPDQPADSRVTKYRAYYGVDPTGEGFYWPTSAAKRGEANAIRRGNPKLYQAVYQGDPRAAEEQVFTADDFRPYAPPEGLAFGLASPAVQTFVGQGRGHVAQAWDTAFGQSQSEALTAGVTGLLLPCNQWHRGEDPAVVGPCEFHFDVLLLDLFAEHVDFSQLVQAVRRQNHKWSPRRVVVEEKASGISLIQTLKSSDVPLYPIKVVEGKIARAVNGVGGGAASVQGWARLGRVMYPAGARWAPDFLKKVLAFSGDAAPSRADEFDAFVHLVTYAILRSRKTGKLPTDLEGGEMAPIVEVAAAAQRNRATLGGLVASLDLAGDSGLQVYGLCGAPCRHWTVAGNATRCALDDSKRMALEGCGRWAK